MNRRNFIKNSAIASIGACLPLSLLASEPVTIVDLGAGNNTTNRFIAGGDIGRLLQEDAAAMFNEFFKDAPHEYGSLFK